MNSKLKKYYHRACYLSSLLLVNKSNAFAPPTTSNIGTTMLWGTKSSDDIIILEDFNNDSSIPEIVRQVAPINGWIKDKIKNCYYVPCAPTPTGYFDHLEFYQVDI